MIRLQNIKSQVASVYVTIIKC